MATAPKKAEPAAVTPTPTPIKVEMSRGIDITLTIVFLALQLVLVMVLFVPALMLVMASDGCGGTCNLDVIQAGVGVAAFGPGAVLVANFVCGLVFMITKRKAWLFTLLGMVASLLVFFLGVALVFLRFG